MDKIKLDLINNEDDFREFCINLLQKSGFKINSIREGAGADGGRDIEAVSFEYDTALREKVTVKWWIELKFRSNNNLGIHDFTDIKTKISNAKLHNIEKFLLITNKKLSHQLFENLIEISHKEGIQLRIWDKDFIKNIVEPSIINTHIKTASFFIVDREKDVLNAINLINTHFLKILLYYGPRGIGKSYLIKYVAKYMNETEYYGYGVIDCAYFSEIGAQIKNLANFLKIQGYISDFTESVSIQKNENERIDMLCEHIKAHPTILILDNFEYSLGFDGIIKSKQLKRLLDFYSTCNTPKSVLILTSRQNNLNENFVESLYYRKVEILGWDSNYILKEQISNFKNIKKQFEDKSFSYEKQQQTLEVLGGNPFAYNIFNQLCANYDIEKLLLLTKGKKDIPQFLIKQFATELPEEQRNAMQRISQFSRPLTYDEIINFVCNAEILEILLLKGLIEKSLSLTAEFSIHPLTMHEFGLNNNINKKRIISELVINDINQYLSDKNIDEYYPHDLARQILNMYINVKEYKKAQELLIRIGTRILSMGDIVYLQSILNSLYTSDLNEKYKNRLAKIKAHLESYTDDLDSAKNTYQTMLDNAIVFEDNWAKSAALNGLGSMARYVYDYENALSNYQESLAIRLNNNMEFEASNSYHNIGATYIIMAKYDDAIDALDKAVHIREKYNDDFRKSASMLYLGECYTLKGDYPKAGKILNQCLNTKEKISDKVGGIWTAIALAKLYVLSEDYIQLENIHQKLEEAEELAESLNLNRHLVLIRMFLGIYCYLKNDMYTAINYYNQGISVCMDLRKDLYETDIRKLNILAATFSPPSVETIEEIKSIVAHHKI